MSRRAYYDFETDFFNRDIKDMADRLHEVKIPYKLTADSLRVGDRVLMKHRNGSIVPYACSIFNTFNKALGWLITDEFGLDVSEHGDIVIKHTNFGPTVMEPKIQFNWTHDPSRFFGRIIPAIKRIEINNKKGVVYTTVIWNDGSKPTVVKKSEDDSHDPYFAVASAIAIKVYGSNSAFKREIEEKTEDITEKPSLMDTTLR